MLWNMAVLTVVPPVRCFWRWRLRRKYVVQGMLIGDVIAVTLCCVCATLQEAREVRVGQVCVSVCVYSMYHACECVSVGKTL